ncbi:MAG: Ketol-acid reductoisomerase (NADP(+)), partial [uncultured Frankineae bacterium]
GRDLLRRRRRPRPHREQEGGRPGLRQPGPRARAVAARLRGRRPRRSARGQQEPRQGRAGGPAGRHARRGGGRGRRDHDPGSGHRAAHAVRGRRGAAPRGRERAVLRARPQHPLRAHHAAGRRRRRDGRAQGTGPPRAPAVRRRPRRPLPGRRGAGRLGAGAGAGAVVRQGHRRHQGRRAAHDLHRGDRDRPVRRAGRALRRRVGAGDGRLRGPHRGGLPARGGVLRVPARAQADRRPDVRGRHRQDALVGLRHGRVRRLRLRAAHHHARRQAGDGAGARRDQGRHLRQAPHRGRRERRQGAGGVPRHRRRPPDREGRRPAAADDGLDRRRGGV